MNKDVTIQTESLLASRAGVHLRSASLHPPPAPEALGRLAGPTHAHAKVSLEGTVHARQEHLRGIELHGAERGEREQVVVGAGQVRGGDQREAAHLAFRRELAALGLALRAGVALSPQHLVAAAAESTPQPA